MAVKSKIGASAFRDAARRPGTGTCLLVTLFTGLSNEDVAHTRAAFADRSIQHAAILRVLSGVGFTGTINVIRRHRDYGCRHCGIPAWR